MNFKFDNVESLDSYNRFFNKVFQSKPFVLLVYSTNCGYCIDLLKDKGAWKSAKKHSQHPVVEIEADMYYHLQKNHPDKFTQILDANVSGYPTIMKIENPSSGVHFQGQRTKEDLKILMSSKKETKTKNNSQTNKTISKLNKKYS